LVWWATVDLFHDGLTGLLDPVERSRLAPRRPDDQRRSALGAVLLRLAVEQATGTPAATVTVERGCATCSRPHGPPRLPGTALHASVSHSGELVVVAVSGVAAVGVDVERHAPVERALMEYVGGGDLRGFFVVWTRKESAVKATGDGLRVPVRDVVVTDPDRPPALLRYPGRPAIDSRMYDLTPGDGYAAALTILTGAPVAVRECDAAELLAAHIVI
jgi:4'-phosphopantetheinyl transferase